MEFMTFIVQLIINTESISPKINKRLRLRVSIFLLILDLSVDDVILEDRRVLDPRTPVPVFEPETVVHVCGHAKVALVGRNQNLKRTIVLVVTCMKMMKLYYPYHKSMKPEK